ncbi:MAG TPA: PadR family transcriptional regulator [Dehalococcoidales bacterium]|jgi:DNA-binding PadR family transcriptional regulator|nr:PadR family transcriptional regulator [Dehalococcoidales bacterium]
MTSDDLPQGINFPTEPLLKGILSIAIIELVKVKPIHGGEIYQSLKEKFQIDTPRGIIYTILRKMEGEGLLFSKWDIQESGPARRIYHITEEGLEYLKYAMDRLRRSKQIIMLLLREET